MYKLPKISLGPARIMKKYSLKFKNCFCFYIFVTFGPIEFTNLIIINNYFNYLIFSTQYRTLWGVRPFYCPSLYVLYFIKQLGLSYYFNNLEKKLRYFSSFHEIKSQVGIRYDSLR